jgi:hypothetical protein
VPARQAPGTRKGNATDLSSGLVEDVDLGWPVVGEVAVCCVLAGVFPSSSFDLAWAGSVTWGLGELAADLVNGVASGGFQGVRGKRPPDW